MTYEEHLAWCKKRALEYADAGDLANAVTSMGSDITKHEEGMRAGSMGHSLAMSIGLLLVLGDDLAGVRRWIKGFN